MFIYELSSNTTLHATRKMLTLTMIFLSFYADSSGKLQYTGDLQYIGSQVVAIIPPTLLPWWQALASSFNMRLS